MIERGVRFYMRKKCCFADGNGSREEIVMSERPGS